MKNNSCSILIKNIFPVLAPSLRRVINKIDEDRLSDLMEIRLRVNKPLIIERSRGEMIIDKNGSVTNYIRQAYIISKNELKETLNLMSNSSWYTMKEELKAGYLTLDGGHRVGFVGQVIVEKGKIKRIKHITGLNIRLCQEIIGAADGVIKEIITGKDDIYNTLIISPPCCGKTTLLRDLTRQISNGINKFNFKGQKVGVVDERSEIGGAYHGVPRNRLGIRTDLLDRAPKAEGMFMLIRSMSPDVIITDEIGSKEDVIALQEALNAGIKIITTVHGNSLKEIKMRPSLQGILEDKIFKRIIILSRRRGPGTVEEIIKN